jgi:hypothetical protein
MWERYKDSTRADLLTRAAPQPDAGRYLVAGDIAAIRASLERGQTVRDLGKPRLRKILDERFEMVVSEAGGAVTTLQTADGRLLRAQRPALAGAGGGCCRRGVRADVVGRGALPERADGRRDGSLASFESIYRSQPVLAGVVDMMAYRAATLPLGAFTANADGSRTPVPRSDSLATLLRRPRPRASTVHLLSHIYSSLFVHGNALVAQLRTHGDPDLPPDMLWPLDWSQVTAYGEPGGDIEWWGTFQFGGNEELFAPADRTLHFAWAPPSGGQIGVSPLEKLGVTIRTEDAAQRYQTANFRNGNRPSSIISFEKGLRKEAIDRNLEALEGCTRASTGPGRMMAVTGDTRSPR